MLKIRARINGLTRIMKRDAIEFCRRTGWTAWSIYKKRGIPNVLLAFLHDETAKEPSLKTLTRIEETFADHPDWPGATASLWRETGSAKGFILRRVLPEWRHDRFLEVLTLWEDLSHRPDLTLDRVIESVSHLEGATVIDTRPGNPKRYIIARHAPASIRAGNGDATGKEMGSHRADFYADATIADYAMAYLTGEPSLSEIVWAADGTLAGAYFLRLILPLPNALISITHIYEDSIPLDVARLSQANSDEQ